MSPLPRRCGAVCPLCSVPVEAYEWLTGMAYVSDHGGPFGGTGTYLVAAGGSPPAGVRYDRVVPQRWLSKYVLRPCGCELGADTFKMFATADGTVFRIEGERFFNPL